MHDPLLDRLTDTVHYDSLRSPFSGNGGRFSCCYTNAGPLGIGPVHARACQGTRFVTQATLQHWLRHADRWQAPQRQRLRSHPSHCEESASWRLGGTDLELRCRTVYADPVTAWHELVLRNRGAAPITLDLAAVGQVDPDGELGPKRLRAMRLPRGTSREPVVEAAGRRVRCGLRGAAELLPCPMLQIDAIDEAEQASTGELPIWADGSPAAVVGPRHFAFLNEAVTIPPGGSHRRCWRLAYVVAHPRDPEPDWPAVPTASPDIDGLIAVADEQLATGLGDGEVDTQLARARYTLLRCRYHGSPTGAYGGDSSCLCTPGITAFSITYFWDALFSAAAISGFAPDYAKQAWRVPLRRIKGRWAQRNWDHRCPGNEPQPQPQAPVASWALSHHLALHDDEAWLAACYPTMVELHRFWETQDSDGDGLPEWRHTGLNADNGPHYLSYMPPGVHNVYIPPVASVSLASFLYQDARLLAGFAERLGRTGDVQAWHDRADRLAEALLRVCWHAEDRLFYDYDHHLGEHNRVKTHLVFWPLWAGVPIAEADKRHLIDDVLLDPAQFNGAVPFPTCAYDDPHYDAESYWSGRSWPHISYWLCELLAREGYTGAARSAAARWLAWQSGHSGHREAVTTDPHLTEHCERGDFSYRTGRDFDYNWSAAAVAMLCEERWTRHIPSASFAAASQRT